MENQIEEGHVMSKEQAISEVKTFFRYKRTATTKILSTDVEAGF